MFKVTRDLYHAEMATAVYDHMRDYLLTREKNHCERVDYLPVEVMHLTCLKLREDEELKKRGVVAYVLAEKAEKSYEIESGKLIEERNRVDLGVLVAFYPQGLRLPSEDSLDIQTFKRYDLSRVLRSHVRKLLASLPEKGQEIVHEILSQPAIKRLRVECLIKYLIALKNDGAGLEEAGAYLFHLGLIPDLRLTEEELAPRIDRNHQCVAVLSDADRSVFLAVEELATKNQLNPEENDLRSNLLAFLRDRNVVDPDSWLGDILEQENWREKLTFDKWVFKDIVPAGKVELHLDPLEDPETGEVAKGLRKEGPSLVASTDPKNPINIKWSTYPKKPDSLGHFLILVVRDRDDQEMGEELLRRNVKAGRSSLKVSLKEVELDEGETCAAKIIIQAKDKTGVTLASDESESFYIEGGQRVDEEGPKGKTNQVKNRAEAFFLDACKNRKPVEIDSENWELGRVRLYRIKLKSRDIYRISINPTLYAVELKNLSDPMNLGAWYADMQNRAVLEANDLQSVEIDAPGIKVFANFCEERKHLFHLFQEKDATGVIEVFDLREFKSEVVAYVSAYRAMFEEVQTRLKAARTDGEINNILNAAHRLTRIDTIHLKVGTTDDAGEVVLLAPTHPLRLLWVLQYQQLLFGWAEKLNGVSEEAAAQMVDKASLDKVTSLNIPSAFVFGQGEAYVNSENIDHYWSVLPRGDTPDVRKVVSHLLRLLGHKGNGGAITTITPGQIADKIWRYLKHHPYVSTLRINVLNPGDGLLVLNAIRDIQSSGEYDDLSYDVAFYGDLRYEVMGSAFDELMEEMSVPEGGQPEVDEALLRPNKNPLFPKLTFSKQRVREEDWKKVSIREANITILIDRFSTKVLSRPVGATPGSFCLHNLLAEYRADFDLKGESATWSRKVVPNRNSEILEGDVCAESIYSMDDSLLRVGCSFYDWGNSLDKIPAIQLELSHTDKYLINEIHEKSDWVLTIDRNFGIEYFDNPRTAPGISVRSYLIDYSPEFLDGIGHRLVISTFWLSEIEELIHDGLKKMGFPGTGFQAAQILDILKSISGRLALKLINNPKDAREIIGLALTRLLLEQEGSLRSGVLIPVDSHIDLFTEHRRQSLDVEIKLHRNDLILATADEKALTLRLIEVKFRSGAGGLSEEASLKEAIVAKNEDTQKVFEAKFCSPTATQRLDREIQNKQLANLLQFYFDRGKRHGLISTHCPETMALQGMIAAVGGGVSAIEFEKAGYIFNSQGVSKATESFKNNAIYVIGKEKIKQLLEIPEDVAPPTPPVAEQPAVSGLESKIVQTPILSIPSAKEVLPIEEPPLPPKQEVKYEQPKTQEPPVRVAVTPAVEASKLVPAQATPEKPTAFQISIGKDCDSGRELVWDPFKTSPKKLANQHILIVGKSGAGKTQSTAAFLWELCRAGVPCIIFDFQGEYISNTLVNAAEQTFLQLTGARVLDASDGINVNPFEVPIDPHTGQKSNYQKVVYQVAFSLAQIFGLGEIQHAILRDGIGQAFAQNGFSNNKSTWNNQPPTLLQVWDILRHAEQVEGGNVRNLNLRVQPLFETGVFSDSAGAVGLAEILKTPSIIKLSNLATPELMVAVSRFVLQKLYADMLAMGPVNHLRVFAVIDEAHKLSYDDTLTELIREARKYGVGILLASQSAKDFDRVVFDMVGTKIALQLEGRDAEIMSENLGVLAKFDRDIARGLLLAQPPHRALLRNNHYEPYAQVDVTPFFKKPSQAMAKMPEPTPKEKKIGRYIIRRKLGDGASGIVYEAVDPADGICVAVKMLVSDGDPFKEAQFKREIEMLNRTDPIPKVIKVLDLIREGGQQALVLEYADGGNLHDYVTKQPNGRLSAIEAKAIAIDLAETLQQIHDLKIVHRDLKPENVLRVLGAWKIGDYGISKYLPRPYTKQTLRGAHSPGYSAAEQISGAEAAPSADIFSLGKVCLFMLEGSPEEERLRYIESPGWKKLIQDCIGGDVTMRPSCMAEVRDRLKYV